MGSCTLCGCGVVVAGSMMQVGEGRICGEGEEDEEGERGGERSERDGDGVHTRTGDSAGTVRRGVCVFYDEYADA